MSQIKVTFAGQEFAFATDPKLFSPNQLDAGSRLLLETIRVSSHPITILDLGCGWGAMGIVLAKLYPNTQVMLLDNDPTAISLAKENVSINYINNARTFKADVTYAETHDRFDIIIANPPWTKNLSVNPKLVEFAYKHLKLHGNFYVVINRTFQMEYLLERFFGQATCLVQKSSYKILSSTKSNVPVNDLAEEINKSVATKAVSQYFLSDSNMIGKIIETLEVKPTDIVLEVGSGLGHLTRQLALKVSKVLAVETNLLRYLRDEKRNWNKIIASVHADSVDPFLFRLSKKKFELAILILPKKIGEKLTSGEKLFSISRSYFFPMPDTDFLVIRLRQKS